ncbi:MAG: NADH-quinone oxidoreductase subunit M [Dehalococcoidia bacterium]
MFLPALGAVLAVLLPDSRRADMKLIMAVISFATLGFSIYVFVALDNGAEGFQFQTDRYEWLPGLGATFQLGIDGISAPMVLLTGIVMTTGVFMAWNIEPRTKDFFALLMTLVTGVYGVFLSLDLFFLFFFYELAVVPMYLLIGVWGSTRKEYGALKLVLYLVASSVLVWIGLIAIYVESGLGSFNLLDLEEAGFDSGFQRAVFPILMFGFGVLAGPWPFHTWSPDGHVAAPTSVSMLHAGVLMKLGAYGIIRVGIDLLPEGADDWKLVLVVLATVNVLYGAMSAMAQSDLKYVIGYSSVSHMGYVLMGIGTLEQRGMDGAVYQMFSHGIMTALFFALVGVVYDRAHTRDISVFQGLSKRMGVTAAFFAVAGLTSMGLPGLSGFIAEFLVFVGLFKTYPAIGVLGIIGALVTAVYILRLLARVFFGPLDSRWEKLPDCSRLEGLAMGSLVGVLIFGGVYPQPFTRVIDSGVAPLLERVSQAI